MVHFLLQDDDLPIWFLLPSCDRVQGMQLLSFTSIQQLLAAGLDLCSSLTPTLSQHNTPKASSAAAEPGPACPDGKEESAVGYMSRRIVHLMEALCKLPAAHQLPVDAILPLLRAAAAALRTQQGALVSLAQDISSNNPADEQRSRYQKNKLYNVAVVTEAWNELLQQLLVLPAAQQAAASGQQQCQGLAAVIQEAKAAATGAMVSRVEAVIMHASFQLSALPQYPRRDRPEIDVMLLIWRIC